MLGLIGVMILAVGSYLSVDMHEAEEKQNIAKNFYCPVEAF